MRGRAPLGLAVVLGLGLVGLVLFTLRSRPPDETSAVRDREAGDAPQGDLTAEGPEAVQQPDSAAPDATPLGAQDAPPARPGWLRVRVVTSAGSIPVRDAQVWLLQETEASLSEGLALLAEPLQAEPIVSDEHGWALLPWGEGPGPRRVVAQAPELLVAELRVGSTDVPVLIRLSAGLSIEGRVVDAAGGSVGGVEVEARAARRPLQAAGSGALARLPLRGAEVVRALSDAEGAFRLGGLSAGAYALRPASPGWVATADLPSSTLAPLPGAEGLLAQAGARDVRLMVGAVGAVALHLVDARTQQDVGAPWVSVSLRRPDGGQVVTFSSYGDASRGVGRTRISTGDTGWQATGVPADGPAFVLALVPGPGPARGAAAVVEVEVRAPGYAPFSTSAPLLDPAHVPARPAPGAVDDGWTRLVLAPEGPAQAASITLDCSRPAAGVARPALRLLTFCRETDGQRTYRRGRAVGAERWTFTGLPAGPGTVQVWDGLSRSRALAVTLVEGAEVEGRVEFPAVSGVSFVLLAPDRTRVYDADVLAVAPVGREHGLPDRSSATRLDPAGQVVLPLDPGAYRFAVAKAGQGYAAGSFEVHEGQVTPVVARLGPVSRYQPPAPPHPR